MYCAGSRPLTLAVVQGGEGVQGCSRGLQFFLGGASIFFWVVLRVFWGVLQFFLGGCFDFFLGGASIFFWKFSDFFEIISFDKNFIENIYFLLIENFILCTDSIKKI